MEQTNHDNEKCWTFESLKQEIEGIERYIRGRDKRWAHEDTKRDAYREWQLSQVSSVERERIIVNWTRSDKARIKYRVEARKKTDDRAEVLIKFFNDHFSTWPPPPPSPPCKCAKEKAEITKRRKVEDERMAKSRFKEDTLKAKKRKAHDDLISKKRFEQDARDSLERTKKDEEIAADRAREDKERNDRHKEEHVPGTEC